MDELMQRYNKLNAQTVFNPETYADEWRTLAADFDKAGRPSMAGGCHSRANWYAGTRTGYAQKLSYSEITRIQTDNKRTDPDERLLECDTCQAWTKHIRCSQGWVCGCGDIIWLYTNEKGIR